MKCRPDVPVKGVDAVEGLAAHVEGGPVSLRLARRVLVEAQVDSGSAGDSDQMPAVEVRRVQHGVLREQSEGLDLGDIAGL